ncbi:GIY-YIG nuclease family protein [Candidatus Berkelbacteria bacterium]|nr:GIY-YIG nuclease family protein [Candidatus Berkelbacteria bacterium]MBI2588433.1 GIY-YIG nuclease family protein [Candidatus Berkelbacteria bacterium]MBI4030003.1 GIY-YIG nuclease family protein [Candidatus Berkelbacteria bacterium]
MFYLYILKSKKDDKFYIGITNDLNDRISRHNSGKVTATRFRRPLNMVYYEKYQSYNEVIKRERYLKSLKSHKYINWLINGGAWCSLV